MTLLISLILVFVYAFGGADVTLIAAGMFAIAYGLENSKR